MPKYIVIANALNFRAEPKLTGSVIAALNKGEEVDLIGISGDGYWFRVKRSDGSMGWASHKYLANLDNDNSILPNENFPWMSIAIREIGTREYEGAADNPRIVEYLRSTNLGEPGRSNDETFWFSAFVNWCVEKANYAGTDSAWAKSWLNWGKATANPLRGCICVFSRDTGGHVGFYTGESASHIQVLGGNQSDEVNISNHSKSRLLDYRVPL